MNDFHDDEMEVQPQATRRRNFTIVPNGLIGADISPRAFKTYVALVSYVRPDNPTFPYLRTVAERFGMSESFLQRGIKELSDEGYLIVTKRRSANGMRQSNVYHFPDVDDQPVKSDGSLKSSSNQSNLTVNNQSDLTVINQSNLTDSIEEEKIEEEKIEEDNFLVPEKSVTEKNSLPVTGSRLKDSEGNPASDEYRKRVFDSFNAKLVELILENGGRKPSPNTSWDNAIRLLLEKDRVDPRTAWSVMLWALRDPFWKSNILSMPKFREKYDQLYLKMTSNGQTGARRGNHQQGLHLVAVAQAEEARASETVKAKLLSLRAEGVDTRMMEISNGVTLTDDDLLAAGLPTNAEFESRLELEAVVDAGQ